MNKNILGLFLAFVGLTNHVLASTLSFACIVGDPNVQVAGTRPASSGTPQTGSTNSGSNQRFRISRDESDSNIINLRQIIKKFDEHVVIAHHEPSNMLLFSARNREVKNLVLVGGDAIFRDLTSFRGLAEGARMITARDGDTGFSPGEVFAGTVVPGTIARISADGTVIQNPWVVLPGETDSILRGLDIDRPGLFGGDLIAASTQGRVWRIDFSGNPTLLASLDTRLESVTVVPEDPARYGPWSGKILATAGEQGKIYAIDAAGIITSFEFGISARDMAIVPPDENFFAVDSGDNILWGASSDSFAGLVGDILVVHRDPGILWRVRWTGAGFETVRIAKVSQLDQILFSTAGLGEIAAVAPADKLALIRHSPLINSGRVEGSLWQILGEDVVTFGDPSQLSTSATFSEAGSYVLQLTASDSQFGSSDEVTITVKSTNQPPSVNAGPPQTITLPANASLNGSATDDGLPPGSTLTTSWSKVSGPGTVTFKDPITPVTTATFGLPGIYVLRLAANDTQLTTSSDVTITVKPPNQAPLANAGPPQTITLPGTALLNGTASDDGLPEASILSVSWSMLSGPGNVNFGNSNALQTTAAFSAAGIYVLKLAASDSQLSSSSNVTITANAVVVNQPPAVNAGPDQSITLPASASLAGVATDDGLPVGNAVTVTWSKIAGPGEVTFSNPTGLSTTATFAEPGTYTVRLAATDSQLTAGDDVSVSVGVALVNQPPVVSAGPDRTIAFPNPVNLAGSVTDDGLPTGSSLSISWSKVSGPGVVTFADPTAAVTTATFSTGGTYSLKLTATDTQLSSNDQVVITVATTNQPPAVSLSQPYSVLDLGSLGGVGTTAAGVTVTDGYRMNSLGQVVGYSFTPSGTYHAFIWDRTHGMRDLGTLGGSKSAALDINDSGQIVGYADTATGATHAFIWDSANGMRDLGTLAGTTSSNAWGINSFGEVLGNLDYPNGKVFLWDRVNGMRDLGNLGGGESHTFGGINDFGEASGASATSTGRSRVFLWNSINGMRDLGTLPGDTDSGTEHGLNDRGEVAGWSISGGSTRAALWSDGAVIDLGTLANLPNTVAYDSNNLGQVIGHSSISVGVLWNGTEVRVLSDLVPMGSGWNLGGGRGINDLQQIVGIGSLNSQYRGFLLNPVNGGPLRSVRLPNTVSLDGTVTDDGFPVGGNVSTSWGKVSGPGAVTFGDPSAVATTASFSGPGMYVLRLTATDSQITGSADLTINVLPANQPPSVNAGPDQTITLSSTATLNGAVTDDGLPTGGSLRTEWRQISGPGAVTFDNRNAAAMSPVCGKSRTFAHSS